MDRSGEYDLKISAFCVLISIRVWRFVNYLSFAAIILSQFPGAQFVSRNIVNLHTMIFRLHFHKNNAPINRGAYNFT